MRLGYAAVVLGILHIAARQGGEWLAWITFQRDAILPPFGLILFVATAVVLVLRLIMWYGIVHKKKIPSNAVPVGNDLVYAQKMALEQHATPLPKDLK